MAERVTKILVSLKSGKAMKITAKNTFYHQYSMINRNSFTIPLANIQYHSELLEPSHLIIHLSHTLIPELLFLAGNLHVAKFRSTPVFDCIGKIPLST